MNKLKIRGMQCDAINQLLFGFLAMIFSIADERMAHGGKLRADLVLQSRNQFNADKRGVGKSAFHGIAQLGAGSFRIVRRPQLLIHPFTPEIMHQRA